MIEKEFNEKPTALEMGLSEEFVYSARIVDVLSNMNLSIECEKKEAIHAIEKAFFEYKNKIIKDYEKS